MELEHYKRCNKTLLIVHLITTFFITMGLMAQLAANGASVAACIVPSVINVLIAIVGIVIFVRGTSSQAYQMYVGIAFGVFYVFLMIIASSNAVYPYMIPILISVVMIMDKKLTLITSILFAIANVYRVVYTIVTAAVVDEVLESVMIEAIITVTTLIVVNRGVRLLKKFFDDSLNEIKIMADNDAENNRKMSDVVISVEGDLIADSNNVGDMVHDTAELAFHEKNVAIDAGKQFEEIKAKSEGLSESVMEVKKSIEELSRANDVIVDSVCMLSASSEEIYAGVDEACSISKQNLSHTEGISGAINNIAARMIALK